MTNRVNQRTVGTKYESMAADDLVRRGYLVTDRNFRCRSGEIDLIAIAPDRKTLCFIEVKYRRTGEAGTPAAAVTRRKQQTIVQVSRYYLYIKHMTGCLCRYDVIEILGTEIRHIENAFWS